MVEEVGREMEDADERFEGDIAVGLRFADARREDEAKLAVAGFFVRAHERD